jgi:hypothetical protein
LPRAEITVSSAKSSPDHSTGRWEGQDPIRIVIGRDVLAGGPEAVLTALMHDAAHALAYADGTSDTSRRGIYHSKAFLRYAAPLGLEWPEGTPSSASYGFRDVKFSERAAEYPLTKSALVELSDAIAATLPALAPVRSVGRPDGRVLAVCGCGRKIRVGAGVLADGAIMCGKCHEPFTAVT